MNDNSPYGYGNSPTNFRGNKFILTPMKTKIFLTIVLPVILSLKCFANDLSVTGTANINVLNTTGVVDLQGNTAFFGSSVSGTISSPGMNFAYVDGTTGVSTSFTMTATRPNAIWAWSRLTSTGSTVSVMLLDATNCLILYGTASANPAIILNPNTGNLQATLFSGNFSGDGSGLNNLSASHISGTLPAISGANLTGVLHTSGTESPTFVNPTITGSLSVANISSNNITISNGSGRMSTGNITFKLGFTGLIKINPSGGGDNADFIQNPHGNFVFAHNAKYWAPSGGGADGWLYDYANYPYEGASMIDLTGGGIGFLVAPPGDSSTFVQWQGPMGITPDDSGGTVTVNNLNDQGTLNVQGNASFASAVMIQPQGDLDMGPFTADSTGFVQQVQQILSNHRSGTRGVMTSGTAITTGTNY